MDRVIWCIKNIPNFDETVQKIAISEKVRKGVDAPTHAPVFLTFPVVTISTKLSCPCAQLIISTEKIQYIHMQNTTKYSIAS